MAYSIEAIQDDCYEGTYCLINKLNIRNEKQLERAEADIAFAKVSIWEKSPLINDFSLHHYTEIHRFLFED